MASLNSERYQDEYVTRREYREDMLPLREKVNGLSESHLVTLALIKTMGDNLEKLTKNTDSLLENYRQWLAIKKLAAIALVGSLGASIILFAVDYSGWLRVINRYLNG